MTPKFLRPKTIPTPKMCPTTPQAKVSAKVNPAGSPDCSPESRTSNRSPAVAFLFADGASPNLPANNIRVVDVTIIKFVGEPMKPSQRAPRAPPPFPPRRIFGSIVTLDDDGRALRPLNCGRAVVAAAGEASLVAMACAAAAETELVLKTRKGEAFVL